MGNPLGLLRQRRVLLIVAFGAMTFAVLSELGIGLLVDAGPVSPAQMRSAMLEAGLTIDDVTAALSAGSEMTQNRTVGRAIPALALLDVLIAVAFGGITLGILRPEVQGKVVAPANLVVAVLIVLSAIVTVFVTLSLVALMISLLLAAPFGTITYFVRWGFFPRGTAQAILSLVMTLRLIAAGCVVVAMPRVWKQLRLVLLLATGFAAHLIVVFLHALVPLSLVSITDGIAAIIVALVAVVWAIVIGVFALQGLIHLARSPT